MEFDLFGMRMIVERVSDGWKALYPGQEGKRRIVDWLFIPPDLSEEEIGRYLADVCHEAASSAHPDVKWLR